MPAPPPVVIEKINPSPPPGRRGGWGDKVVDWLEWLALRIYDTLAAPVLDALGVFVDNLFQNVEDELKPVLLPLLDRFDEQDNLPPEFRQLSEHIRHSEPITFAAIASAIIISAIVGFAMGLIRPFQQLATQQMNRVAKPTRFDPPAAFAAWRRGAITEKAFLTCCEEHGWPKDSIDAFSEIFAQRVGVGDLSVLVLRGEMSPGEFDAELGKRGYKPDEIAKLKELQKKIPGVGDLISMAVREAWRDDVAARYGYDADFPAEFAEWAEKQGLSAEWARRYWRAHWNVPGPTQAMDMLWRTDMTEEDYDTLLRIADYPETFRRWMTETAYRTYTRVDVRRMHASGVLNEEDVYRNYLDLGYPPEKATKMTEFTVAYNQQAERDLTRTDVLNGLKIGYFGEEQAHSLIMSLGYSKEEADYYIAKTFYDLWQAEIKEEVKYLEQQYVRSLIGQSEVYAALGKLNLPAEQINRYLRTWDIQRQAKTQTLTRALVQELRGYDIIDDDEFRIELRGLGYKEQYIEWLLELVEVKS